MESFKLFSSKINLVYFLLRRRRFSLAACKTNTINFKLESSNYVKYKYLHCSTILNKRRKTAEERKSSRIIEYSPKSKAPIVQVWRYITPIEIAEILKKDIKFVKQLFLNDYVASTEPIEDMTLLHQIIKRSGHRMEIIGKPRDQLEKIEDKDVYPQKIVNKAFLKPRPPVVTIMGHVDHGKTTLLDALRHSSIVEKEFGGITQHIGAFSVRLDSGAEVTFLDTPGHAAFTTMRARGANVTDLVVLVVAADDGVMEQTIESVKMAKSAKVPILVAINKIDSPKADIERTKRMLQEIDLHVEDLGGDVQTVAISALKRQNLDLLVEALVLQAELLEIKADYNGPAEAVVIESRVDPNRGKLCTLIVKRGTLKKGTILVSNTVFAKIRAMRDAENKILKEVSPGYCAEIEGWKDLPESGDIVLEVESEKRAKEVIHVREMKERLKKEEQDIKVIIQKADEHRKVYEENLQLKRRLGRVKRLKPDGPRQPEFEKDDRIMLNLIIKGDVHGSVEAIIDTLDTYDSNLCDLDLIHSGVGTVTENDVELAQAFNAIIYAFNLNYSDKIQQLADESGVTIKSFNVIYKLVDSVKEELNTKIPPVEIEEICGEAQVLQQFEIDQGKKKIPIAGCKCVKGTLKKSGIYKLIRNGDVIYTGSLSSLRHLKNEVDTIKTNTECGLQLVDKTVTFQPGDTLLYVEKVLRSQEINWDPGF